MSNDPKTAAEADRRRLDTASMLARFALKRMVPWNIRPDEVSTTEQVPFSS